MSHELNMDERGETGGGVPLTLLGKLGAEISRVTALRAQYEEVARLATPMANMRPAIFMMTRSLDAAITAAGLPDIKGQIAAVLDLEGYTK